MRYLLIIAALFFAVGGSQAQPPDEVFLAQGLRPAVGGDLARFSAVPHYVLNLELLPDYEKTVLQGQVHILYTNTTPDTLNVVVLRLYPNYSTFSGDAYIENLRVDGQSIVPTLDETRTVVGVPLPQALPPGSKITLDFDYRSTVFLGRGSLYNLYSYLETELALASTLPLLSVYEPGFGWWRGTTHAQGDAVYSEVSNFDITLRVPTYLKVIASGTLVEQIPDGNMVILRYAVPLMRDFSLVASAKYETLTTSYEDILLKVHYLPGGEAGARKVLVWAVDAMQAFNTLFGAYPYTELDIAQTYTSAGGIEYPGLIVVSKDLWNPNSQRWFEWVTVHEIAHQWWYGLVGNDQPLFPWLDEALTDYSVALYAGFIKGQPAYDEAIGVYQEMYSRYENQNGAGVIGASAPTYTSADAYSALVYRKGAVFFHNLAQLMGTAVFNTALQSYFATYRYGIATPFDLQNVLETTYGAELDDWFIRWVGYSN